MSQRRDVILHELQQLERGGVERIICDMARLDTQYQHKVLAVKDGPMRADFERTGIEVTVIREGDPEREDADEVTGDILHVHCGGVASALAQQVGRAFPVVETVHSPVKSPLHPRYVRQRVGVTDAVTRMNSECVTVHNGIDYDRLKPTQTPEEVVRRLGLTGERKVIGRVGRLAPDKGIEEFLVACHYVQRGLDCDVVIGGDESPKLEPSFLGKAKVIAGSLPVRNVVWAGEFENPYDLLSIFDVFAYPSPTEGFCLVLLEAAHVGVPIVTWKNDVTMEVIGGGAELTEPTATALAEGIIGVLTDGPYGLAIAQEARAIAYDRFRADRMVAGYHAVYNRVLDGRE